MRNEFGSDTVDDVRTSDANFVCVLALAPGLPERPRCAGTETPADGPCEAPVEAEVDGLLLCARHAEEFGAEARADVLEIAASHLSRWLRVAREDLCNDELVRHLEAACEGVEAETGRAYEALERSGGPRRAPVWQKGLGRRGSDPRPEGDGTFSAELADGTARPRRERGGRWGGRR